MAGADLKGLEKIFKAVANRRRLMILQVLKKEEEVTVGIIAERIKLSFKSTSRHLSVLFATGIVEKEQRGLEVYYLLSSNIESIIKHVLSIL